MDISVNPAGGDEGGRLRVGSMTELQEKYATQNLAQGYSEADPFTRERYVQFHHFMPKHAALDCVQSRLDVLPKCYGRAICALSTMWAT